MKDRIYLSDVQIKKITTRLKRLTPAERERVRELLHRLKAEGIGRRELHEELWQLCKEYTISESDMRVVEDALFAEE